MLDHLRMLPRLSGLWIVEISEHYAPVECAAGNISGDYDVPEYDQMAALWKTHRLPIGWVSEMLQRL